MGIFSELKSWSEERGLSTQPFNLRVEATNLLEEIIELLTGVQSHKARDKANNFIESVKGNFDPSDEQVVDALCDVIVYSINAIEKKGYDAKACLQEVVKEIGSREGELVDGKFVKSLSQESKDKWYTADFSKCKRS